MRETKIGQEWYDDDKTTGNKIYITVVSINSTSKKEMQSIYKIINESRCKCLEYLYYIVDNDTYKIAAKFKDRYKPEHRARLRKNLYTFNNSKLNTVESITFPIHDMVQFLSTCGNVSLIKGPMFTKELNINVNIHEIRGSEPNTLRQEFIEFLKKHKLMLLEKSDMFVDSDYKQVSGQAVFTMMSNDENFHRFQQSKIDKLLEGILQTGNLGVHYRIGIPVYRPRRQYIEFTDCIYDTFKAGQISKQHDLLDPDNTVVHPCYKINYTFIYCCQCVPWGYFKNVAKLMEPEMFEWIINQFVGKYVPRQSCIVIGYPSVRNILEPLMTVYGNILYRIDKTNYNTFSWTNCAHKDIICTQGINPLIKYSKNVLFKNSDTLNCILSGNPFEIPGKYNRVHVCSEKIIFALMDDDIVYIPWPISNGILGIQLPRSCVTIDPSEFTDSHIGVCIIANMLTNLKEIKQYIKKIRHDNNWNNTIKVNGIEWPGHDPWKTIPRPTIHRYTISDELDYDELKRI
jgi:hypothetical protein